MAINNHVERWGHIDREAAYDEERLFARRRVRRQLLGLGGLLLLKFALGFLAYALAGWWGVALVGGGILALLFMRGTHAGITPWR